MLSGLAPDIRGINKSSEPLTMKKGTLEGGSGSTRRRTKGRVSYSYFLYFREAYKTPSKLC